MTNQEAISEKVEQLTKAVQDMKGAVLVIGLIDEPDDKSKSVVASMYGNRAKLVEAVARLYNQSAQMRSVLKSGEVIAAIYKMTHETDSDTVIVREENN